MIQNGQHVTKIFNQGTPFFWLCSMDGFRVVKTDMVVKQIDILITCTGIYGADYYLSRNLIPNLPLLRLQQETIIYRL